MPQGGLNGPPGPSAVYYPLTTIFTPPKSCSQGVYTYSSSYVVGPKILTQCFPTSIGGYPPVVFSPGICPEGYKIWSPSISLRDLGTSTAVLTGYRCCPRLVPRFSPTVYILLSTQSSILPFTLTGDDLCSYGAYTSSSDVYPILSWLIFPSTASTSYSITRVSTGTIIFTSPTSETSTYSIGSQIPVETTIIVPERTIAFPTTTAGFNIWASALSFQFQATDSEVVSWWNRYVAGSSNSSLGISTQSGNVTNTASLAPSSPSSTSTGSSSVSAGAIAGIVVGVIVGFLLLLGALLLFLRRRKRARRTINDSTFDGAESQPWTKSELDATAKQVAELDSARFSELEDPKQPPVELPAHQVTSELPDQPDSQETADLRVWNRT